MTIADQQNNEPTSFKNRKEAHKWLDKNGWMIAQATFYLHCSEGKLKFEPDGSIALKTLRKYAKTFLKRKETGKREQAALDEKLQRKAELEIEKMEEEVARSRLKRNIEEGKYIPRDQIELELASRAAVLDAGLTHLFQSQAGALIEVAGGDPRKTAEVVQRLIAEKDRFLNQYAAAIQYTVEIAVQESEDM